MKNDFDNLMFDYFKNIIQKSIDYSGDISGMNYIYVYVYVSFEWVVFFDVFYNINNKIYERHKLNQVALNVDVSKNSQSSLMSYCNSELQKIKELFLNYSREVPAQIKITYSFSGEFESKFSYKKHHNDELFIGDDSLANDWFQELQKENKADGI